MTPVYCVEWLPSINLRLCPTPVQTRIKGHAHITSVIYNAHEQYMLQHCIKQIVGTDMNILVSHIDQTNKTRILRCFYGVVCALPATKLILFKYYRLCNAELFSLLTVVVTSL